MTVKVYLTSPRREAVKLSVPGIGESLPNDGGRTKAKRCEEENGMSADADGAEDDSFVGLYGG